MNLRQPSHRAGQTQGPAPPQLGSITVTRAYLGKLKSLILSEEELKAHAYRVMVYNQAELMNLRRCMLCCQRLHKKKSKKKKDEKKGDKDKKKSEKSDDSEKTENETSAASCQQEGTEGTITQQEATVETITQKIEAVLVSAVGSTPVKSLSEKSSSADTAPTKLVVTINTETEETTIRTEIMTEEEVQSGKGEKEPTDQAEAQAHEKKEQNEKEKEKEKEKKKPKPCCCSHPGRLYNKRFTCCQKHASEPGCVERDHHEPNVNNTLAQLELDWQLRETPRYVRNPRLAVAIDCEMGINKKGDSELIRVSAVDYFTGEVLLDALVFPTVPMKSLMTKYSGVNWKMLNVALATGRCIMGRTQALHHLWQFVGSETIVVAHGGSSDLLVLRWIHRRMVDTFQVESRHVNAEGSRSLKNLVAVRLQRAIQNGPGHDSIEDAMACRELTHWYVEHLADLKDGAARE